MCFYFQYAPTQFDFFVQLSIVDPVREQELYQTEEIFSAVSNLVRFYASEIFQAKLFICRSTMWAYFPFLFINSL